MSSLLDRTSLVVSQKAKLIEVTNQYKLLDDDGKQVGAVNQVGQSKAKKAIRLLTKMDQFLTHKLEVTDENGQVVLAIERPAKLMKSKVHVTDGSGTQIGSITQQNMIGKIRFNFETPDGTVLGELKGENWRAWDFAMTDAQGNEVGRINKKFGGVVKELFTTADNYRVELSPSLSGQLRPLAFAAAVAVDTALKQDDT